MQYGNTDCSNTELIPEYFSILYAFFVKYCQHIIPYIHLIVY